MASEFQEKYGPWAIIVGASHGVGAQFARLLAAEGLNCVLLARSAGALEALQVELQQSYSVQTRLITQDLTASNAVDNILAQTADLDIGLVIYNAGAPPYAREFLKAPFADWQKLVQLNVLTMMSLCYQIGPKLLARGRGGLLLVGSQAGLGGNKKYSLYTATKGFMLNFGESLWIEWKDKGIDVLNLLISVVDSPTLRKQMQESNIPGWDQDDIGVATPEEVAKIGLRELANGPTFLHPQDELSRIEASANAVSEGDRRREAMVQRWAITAPFVGDD